MAYTRFYFQNAAPGYTPPSIRGYWDVGTNTLARKLAKTKSGTLTSISASHQAADYGPCALMARFVTDPLPYAKTIRGKFRMCLGVKGSYANGFIPQFHLWVTQGNTDVVRGTLFSNFYWIDNYWSTSALGRTHPQNDPAWADGWDFGQLGYEVAVQPGDRIVIEVGYYAVGQLPAPSGTGYLYYGGTNATDLTQDAAASTYTGWVEFSEDPFSPEPVAVAVTDAGAGTDALSLGISLRSSDSGAGADLLSLLAAVAAAEAGSGADAATHKAALFMAVADLAAGDDALALRTALQQAISDTGAGLDAAALTIALKILAFEGHQTAMAAVGLGAVYDPRRDTGAGIDAVSALVTPAPIADSGLGADLITSLAGYIGLQDTGLGVDRIADALVLHVYIRTDGTVSPLGIIVLQGSREDVLPSIRENSEVIPGRPGEVSFKAELGPRGLELRAASRGALTPAEKNALKRYVAEWLQPSLGVFNLGREDDPERYLQVRAAGAIQAEEFREYLEFTIPLKAINPLYIGSTLHTMAGDGTATNEGTTDAPMTIRIRGPVTNPAMQIGGFSLTWHGTIGAADELVIDTELRTVTFNGVNARSGLTGAWPVLQPGENAVTAPATGSMTLSWRDRWV